MESTLACLHVALQSMGRFCERVARNDALITIFRSDTTWEKPLRLHPFRFKNPENRLAARDSAGVLSANYLQGRRVGYVSPLRLFLLLSVVYYLSNRFFRTTRSRHLLPYSSV